MSNIIESLLLRNLQEVFGEGDRERRRSETGSWRGSQPLTSMGSATLLSTRSPGRRRTSPPDISLDRGWSDTG